LIGSLSRVAESIFPNLQTIVGSLLGYLQYLPWLVLVPVLSFFMLRDAADFERTVVSLLPTEKLRKRVHWMLLDVSSTLAAYTRAQILSCLVVGVQVTVIFTALRVPYALVLGAVSAIFEFVPMVGPLVAAIVAFSLTLTSSFKLALVAVLALVVLRIVHDYVVYPRIVGHGIKMHPMVVILAILVGAELGGLAGIFLGIPFVGLIMVTYHHYRAYRNQEFQAGGGARKESPPQQEMTLAGASVGGEVSPETTQGSLNEFLADAGASLISSDIQSEIAYSEEVTIEVEREVLTVSDNKPGREGNG
jgi:predicted PurR-regulated permease PerM